MKNSKVVILLSCLFGATLTAPLVTAASHGGGFSGGHSFAGRPGMGMPGRPGMGMPGHPGMGMFGRPGIGMRSGGNRHDHFDHHEDEDVIFIGSFGFPSWLGWGWGPWWGWGYPYGYYGYGDPYGYGYGYGYGDYGSGNGYSSRSRVAELQHRLARAGYYHGSIDGVLGPQTRRAIRTYERDRGYAS